MEPNAKDLTLGVLSLELKAGDSVWIGKDIEVICVARKRGSSLKLRFVVPKSISIDHIKAPRGPRA